MKTKSFASDNNAGIHPDIMTALTLANQGDEIGYGDDDYTRNAILKFKKILGDDIEVFFVGGGTAANVLGIATAVNSYNAVICAESAHINTNECGALEKFTGCKILAIPTNDGKITVPQIVRLMHDIGNQHHVQPKVISISQPTEMGTTYTPIEIRDISIYARMNHMYVHMDGARIANAVASLDENIKDITGRAGVDILSFGGTKNGMMFGEAVIFFNRDLAKNFPFIRKQGVQLFSKMRFISAQFDALLSNNLWIDNAYQANEMAWLLETELISLNIEITQIPQTNTVIAKLPKDVIPKLLEKYFFYVWNEEASEVRFVTAFDTQEKDVELFIECIKEVLADK
jgi:threonine aldolase